MSLDVWFKDDIRNTLLAIDQASAAAAACAAAGPHGSHDARLYREGFQDAMRAVATAFGISIPNRLTEPLYDNLRLPKEWTEVEYATDLNGV